VKISTVLLCLSTANSLMSARSTPVKGMPVSPARSVRSTPSKASPTKSTSSSILGNPSSRPSSAIKASSEGSWNLEESNGKDINLETNVVNKAFQINKQLYGNDDLDVNEEAREMEKATAERLERQSAKVEAFQTTTHARAQAAKKMIRKKRKTGADASAPAAAEPARPSTAPADSDSGLSRRLAIAAKKAAELALQTKPLVKKVRRSKKVGDSLRCVTSQAEQELAAAMSQARVDEARSRAAARSRLTSEKLAAARAKEEADAAVSASKPRIHGGGDRAPLCQPLTRNMAAKTTAPRLISSTFDIESTAIVQLSGLVGNDGTRYVGVDHGMVEAFEALSAITPQMIKELICYVRPPVIVQKVCEAVCVLVGEEPGWVTTRNLLKRRDFVPALALSSVENIPFARIRKLRSLKYLQDPILAGGVEHVRKVSNAAAALALWVMAIDAAAPTSTANGCFAGNSGRAENAARTSSAAAPAIVAAAAAATVAVAAAGPATSSAEARTFLSTAAFARSLKYKRGYAAPSPKAKSELRASIEAKKSAISTAAMAASSDRSIGAVSDSEEEGAVEIVNIDVDEDEDEEGAANEFMAAMQTALDQPIYQDQSGGISSV